MAPASAHRSVIRVLRCLIPLPMFCLSAAALLLLAVLVLFQHPELVHGKGQYVQPVATGLKMCTPYDIANIFNVRPISSVVSIISVVFLGIILFFGVITAPFGYFFGIPSRKYVMAGLNGTDTIFAQPRNFRALDLDETHLYEYESNAFRFIPSEIKNEADCKNIILCYSHSALHHLPKWMVRLYKIYSERHVQITETERRAILSGISSRENCPTMFNDCKETLFTMVVKSFRNLLPDALKNRHFQRRKAAMYM